MAKRKRRAFTEEFKTETVRLIRESGKSIAVVARELGLTEELEAGGLPSLLAEAAAFA